MAIEKETIILFLLSRHNMTYSIIGLWVMVFNATFNNISAISWWSVLLVNETRIPVESHRSAASH